MKNIIPLRLLVLVMLSVVSISKADEVVENEIENDKIKLHLEALDKEAKFGVIRYEIPDLYRKKYTLSFLRNY